ncbi:MAG: ATP-binding protein [Flavobacteriales bacterium]|nr:ATP-binding protein [Flavobacteriales bacterium]
MSYVIQMIAEGEHQKQDFKMRVEDASKIARTLCAFANTDGGRLLIGVKDNGSIAGVRADEEFHMIQAAAEMQCKPPISFDVQIWKAEMKTVLEVQIPRSASRPHFCKDEKEQLQAYLRREDRIHRASPVLVKVWQYEMRLDRSEFRYDQHIGKLFSAWRSGRVLSFRHVARMARLDFDAAEDLLCLLIVWGIVGWEYGPKGWNYSLNDGNALDQLETSGVEAFRWKDHR